MMLAASLALTLSVVMHVAWNLTARRTSPDARFLWWALAAFLVLVGPWSVYALAVDAAWSWRLAGLLAITCVAEAVYFLALGAAYRQAPVPLVYPIARSSPVWIALWTTQLFGEALSPRGWIGIIVSVAGVIWLATTARGGAPRKAVPWAIAAALATSVYSTANKLAVPALPGYATQLGYVSITFVAAWLALSWENRRHFGRWRPRLAPHPVQWVVGGLLIGNAYGLVIYAMQFLPAAYAVAFTNAGIVLAGLIAMIGLREREHWRQRLAAMLTVCAGLALLARA